jgi:periplasmic protein CpxP/Spy
MAFHFHRRFAATAVLAALALPALAQQPPAPPSAPMAGAMAQDGRHQAGERHHGHKGGGKHHGNRAEYRAKHLAALKSDLNLTAAQEPAWTAFTTSMQPGERTARLDRKDMDKLTTPERIDRMRALRAQRAAEADRRGEVTKTFYAALTPEQQKTFDAKAHRGGHRMKGGGGEGRHGQHGHHHGKRAGAEGKPAAPAPAQ